MRGGYMVTDRITWWRKQHVLCQAERERIRYQFLNGEGRKSEITARAFEGSERQRKKGILKEGGGF